MLEALAEIERIRTDTEFAQRVYAALCNKGWRRGDEGFSCSWRAAGAIVADLRREGDYLDWYCSGGEDDPVASDVRDALAPFGWEPCPLDDAWELQRRPTGQ
jgi:hypothetical protein